MAAVDWINEWDNDALDLRTEYDEMACDVKVIRVGEKAILCRNADGTGSDEWVPKSCIAKESTIGLAGTVGVVIVPRWLANKKVHLRFDERLNPE